MTTSVTSLTSAWSLIQNGPIESIAIQAGSRKIVYRIAATEPATGAPGHGLNPGAGVTIGLETGENLYARSALNLTSSLTFTV